MRVKGFAWLSAVSILVLGCQSQVIGGSTGSGGSGGSVSTGPVDPKPGTGGAGGGTTMPVDDGPVIAMLHSQIPPVKGGDTSGAGAVTSTGSGAGVDPDSLVLFVSNTAQSCGDPYQTAAGCAVSTHQVIITLAPASQAVGTYSLDQIAYMSESEPGGGGTCSGGGGSYWDGTIQITAIDATHVDFTLAGTTQIIGGGGTSDGAFTAKRCP